MVYRRFTLQGLSIMPRAIIAHKWAMWVSISSDASILASGWMDYLLILIPYSKGSGFKSGYGRIYLSHPRQAGAAIQVTTIDDDSSVAMRTQCHCRLNLYPQHANLACLAGQVGFASPSCPVVNGI